MFSGVAASRTVVAILLLSSQAATVKPICVSFTGNGSKREISTATAYVSDNSIGITCTPGEGSITIPAFSGAWGNYRIILLDEGLNVAIK